jgi:hypothetical protein
MPLIKVRTQVTAEARAAEASDVCFAYNARARRTTAQVIDPCYLDQLMAARRSMAVKTALATAACDDEHEDAHGGTGSDRRKQCHGGGRAAVQDRCHCCRYCMWRQWTKRRPRWAVVVKASPCRPEPSSVIARR